MVVVLFGLCQVARIANAEEMGPYPFILKDAKIDTRWGLEMEYHDECPPCGENGFIVSFEGSSSELAPFKVRIGAEHKDILTVGRSFQAFVTLENRVVKAVRLMVRIPGKPVLIMSFRADEIITGSTSSETWGPRLPHEGRLVGGVLS